MRYNPFIHQSQKQGRGEHLSSTLIQVLPNNPQTSTLKSVLTILIPTPTIVVTSHRNITRFDHKTQLPSLNRHTPLSCVADGCCRLKKGDGGMLTLLLRGLRRRREKWCRDVHAWVLRSIDRLRSDGIISCSINKARAHRTSWNVGTPEGK